MNFTAVFVLVFRAHSLLSKGTTDFIEQLPADADQWVRKSVGEIQAAIIKDLNDASQQYVESYRFPANRYVVRKLSDWIVRKITDNLNPAVQEAIDDYMSPRLSIIANSLKNEMKKIDNQLDISVGHIHDSFRTTLGASSAEK